MWTFALFQFEKRNKTLPLGLGSRIKNPSQKCVKVPLYMTSPTKKLKCKTSKFLIAFASPSASSKDLDSSPAKVAGGCYGRMFWRLFAPNFWRSRVLKISTNYTAHIFWREVCYVDPYVFITIERGAASVLKRHFESIDAARLCFFYPNKILLLKDIRLHV